jgi:anti-sigma factor RsiW
MSDAASRLSERELADLCALADGTLPADRRATVEAMVAGSLELQELLDRQRRAVEATRALEREPTPASLREAVEADRRVRRSRRGGTGWLVPRLGVAGALAAVVAVVAVLVLSGGPGGPTVAEAAQLTDRPPSGPAPPGSAESSARLALDVDGVVFPDLLRRFGWRAVGVRRDRLDGRNATTVFYEKGERRIAYVIVAGDGLPRPDAPESTYRGVTFRTLRVDGRLAVTWRRLGRTCVLVGAASRDELLALARYY